MKKKDITEKYSIPYKYKLPPHKKNREKIERAGIATKFQYTERDSAPLRKLMLTNIISMFKQARVMGIPISNPIFASQAIGRLWVQVGQPTFGENVSLF